MEEPTMEPKPDPHLDDSDAYLDNQSHGSFSSGQTTPQLLNAEEFAQKESKRVFWFRIILLITLLLSTVVVCASVFLYIDNAEQEEFRRQFNSDSEKVLDSFGKVFDDTLGATDAFALKIVAHARYSNSTWPVSDMRN